MGKWESVKKVKKWLTKAPHGGAEFRAWEFQSSPKVQRGNSCSHLRRGCATSAALGLLFQGNLTKSNVSEPPVVAFAPDVILAVGGVLNYDEPPPIRSPV